MEVRATEPSNTDRVLRAGFSRLHGARELPLAPVAPLDPLLILFASASGLSLSFSSFIIPFTFNRHFFFFFGQERLPLLKYKHKSIDSLFMQLLFSMLTLIQMGPVRAPSSWLQYSFFGGWDGFYFYIISNLEDIFKNNTRISRAPSRPTPLVAMPAVLPGSPQTRHSAQPSESKLETLPLPLNTSVSGRPSRRIAKL